MALSQQLVLLLEDWEITREMHIILKSLKMLFHKHVPYQFAMTSVQQNQHIMPYYGEKCFEKNIDLWPDGRFPASVYIGLIPAVNTFDKIMISASQTGAG